MSVSDINKPLRVSESQSAGNVLFFTTSTNNELHDESDSLKSYAVPTLVQAQKGVISLSVISITKRYID